MQQEWRHSHSDHLPSWITNYRFQVIVYPCITAKVIIIKLRPPVSNLRRMAWNDTIWHGYIAYSRHCFHRFEKYNNLFNHTGLIWNQPSPERIHIFWVHWAAGDRVRVLETDDRRLIWNSMIIWNTIWKLITACMNNRCYSCYSPPINVRGEILLHKDTMGQNMCA